MILRPETTMESCAHEFIFWFIPRHGIKTYMGYSGYGGVCMEVVSRSTWNQSLLIRGDRILCILNPRWLRKVFWPKVGRRLERDSKLLHWSHHWLIKNWYEYVFEFDMNPYSWTYSGCRMIEGLNCTITCHWRGCLVFPSNFTSSG